MKFDDDENGEVDAWAPLSYQMTVGIDACANVAQNRHNI